MNNKITLELNPNHNSALKNITLEYCEDICLDDLLSQIITPLLFAQGFQLESMRNCYEEQARILQEILDVSNNHGKD